MFLAKQTWRRKRKLLKLASVVILCLFVFIILKKQEPRISIKHFLKGEKEKTNFVYIKMIKCGSETLASLFRRYGYVRNLSFVLPVSNKIYIGWPYLLEDSFYRPSKTGGFNILCDHAVYDEERMGRLMPQDTVYITSIREPFAQFKSMFHYYNLKNIAHVEGTNPISSYLHNIAHYEKIYQSKDAKQRYCIPDGLAMTKNLMAFNLGFPLGYPAGTQDFSDDKAFVTQWIQNIDKKFSLVIITEYFHESLVLLKRHMVWGFKDILYNSKNIGKYSYKNVNVPEDVRLYREWSNVDYLLYDYLNQSFWRKIHQETDDFMDEVAHYRYILEEVALFCETFDFKHSEKAVEKWLLHIPRTRWDQGFQVDQTFCTFLNSTVREEVLLFYDKMPGKVAEIKPSKEFC